MIHFENQSKKPEKMEIKRTDLEMTFTPTAEDLWAKFEQTGSVETFLSLVQKTDFKKELLGFSVDA